jgi:hypothetical protein
MKMRILLLLIITISFLITNCEQGVPSDIELKPISVADFEKFVTETNYITDAERYGWSILQLDVYNFEKVDSANWRIPDGKNLVTDKRLPVTQVSYNDAKAYANWIGGRLPTYEEYWDLTKNDIRTIVSDNQSPISPVDSVNIIGNVWEITEPIEADKNKVDQIRLAGGSLFCSEKTCHGTQRDRALFVDKETGNIHIGFSVIMEIQ